MPKLICVRLLSTIINSMDTNLLQTLKNIGLNAKEAVIYLDLAKNGESLPSAVARRTQLKRPTVYSSLEQLKSKGLVSAIKKAGCFYFRTLNPHSLLEKEYLKYSNLEKAIPELLHLNASYDLQPAMSVFEGKEGIINIMNDTLTSSTELLCFADSLIVAELLKDYYSSYYIPQKIKRGIFLRGVFSYDKRSLWFKKNSKKHLREVYMLPREEFPFKNEINIYDNKVAIISHEDQVGVIIENKNIADTQRSIFEICFKYAKMREKDLLTEEDKKYLGIS